MPRPEQSTPTRPCLAGCRDVVVLLLLLFVAVPTAQAEPRILRPTDNSVLKGPRVTFEWVANGVTVSRWWLWLGSRPGGSDLYESAALSPARTSVSVDALPTDGRTVYARLWYLSAGERAFSDARYTAAMFDTEPPALTAPEPGTELPAWDVTFRWTANDTRVSAWRLTLGSTTGNSDLFDSGRLPRSARAQVVSDLPTDGRPVFLRLWYSKATGYGFTDADFHAPIHYEVMDLRVVDTAPGVLARVYGSTGNGSLGVPVSGGHDCDGDDLPDSGFSSILASPLGRTRSGEVALVFGDGTVGGSLNTAGFPPNVLKIAGDQDFETAGSEIWMDDVTGDGLGDLLIGRQNYTPGPGREGAGALTILVGSPQLRLEAAGEGYLDLRSPPSGLTLVTFVGPAAYDRLGIWMRTGDVTGDGIADIVVGADETDAPGAANAGSIFVIRGGEHLADNALIDLADPGATPLAEHIARVNAPPGSQGFHMGATCQIADLDGNGRGEVLAAAALNRAGASLRLPGAPAGTGQAVGGSPRGTLYILWDDNFPDGPWPPGFTFEVSSAPGSRSVIQGGASNDAFGEEIIGGLDFNADTTPELFVGDLTADGLNGQNAGSGIVFYNAGSLKGLDFAVDDAPAAVSYSLIEGPLAGSIGADTVAQGDFDGDGAADLVICNPHDEPLGRISAGSMHILYGQPGNWPALIDLSADGLPGPETMRIAQILGANGAQPGDAGDTLCYSAASGDMDGDGHTDIIVNEMVGNGVAPEAIDVGNLIVVSGSALLAPRPCYPGEAENPPTGLLACPPAAPGTP